MIAKITNWVKSRQKDLFLGLCLILVAGIAYNIGKIRSSGVEEISANLPLQIQTPSKVKPKVTPVPKPKDQRVVASKSAKSKLYHYTWCSGAQRIKETNKLWFESASAAESAGYSLAGNCN
ncbi:hypothetical protein KW791_04090 [Candidatus Parcubacteria bacterium]|nr:hypothetical protein [Candidatus Parcubacteria bacterium]